MKPEICYCPSCKKEILEMKWLETEAPNGDDLVVYICPECRAVLGCQILPKGMLQ